MLAIPSALQSKFKDQLQLRAIPNNLHGYYQKWLRYYLDFCLKHCWPPRQEGSLAPFLRKLQDKQQSERQRAQAATAIFVYYDILRETGLLGVPHRLQTVGPLVRPGFDEQRKMVVAEPPASQSKPEPVFASSRGRFAPKSCIQNIQFPSSLPKKVLLGPAVPPDSVSAPATPGTGASWRAEYTRLAEEIHHDLHPYGKERHSQRTAKSSGL